MFFITQSTLTHTHTTTTTPHPHHTHTHHHTTYTNTTHTRLAEWIDSSDAHWPASTHWCCLAARTPAHVTRRLFAGTPARVSCSTRSKYCVGKITHATGHKHKTFKLCRRQTRQCLPLLLKDPEYPAPKPAQRPVLNIWSWVSHTQTGSAAGFEYLILSITHPNRLSGWFWIFCTHFNSCSWRLATRPK